MPQEVAARFRAMVTTATCLAAERLEIQLAVKDICHEMSSPTKGSMSSLARYLVEYLRLEWDFGRKEKAGEDAVHVFADGERAGCPRQAGGGPSFSAGWRCQRQRRGGEHQPRPRRH